MGRRARRSWSRLTGVATVWVTRGAPPLSAAPQDRQKRLEFGDVFRASAAGHNDSVRVPILAPRRCAAPFSRRDARWLPDRRWLCRAPSSRLALRAELILFCRMLAESTLNIEINCSSLLALAGGAGGFGFQNKRFELLAAIQAFEVVYGHGSLLFRPYLLC